MKNCDNKNSSFPLIKVVENELFIPPENTGFHQSTQVSSCLLVILTFSQQQAREPVI